MAQRRSFGDILKDREGAADFTNLLSYSTSIYDDDKKKVAEKSSTQTTKASKSSYTRPAFSEIKPYSPFNQDDFNEYLKKTQDLSNRMSAGYTPGDPVSTGNQYSGFKSEYDDLSGEADRMRGFLNANKDAYGKDYGELSKYLDSFKSESFDNLKAYHQYYGAGKAAESFMDQFKDQDEYDAYSDIQSLQDADEPTIQKKISENEAKIALINAGKVGAQTANTAKAITDEKNQNWFEKLGSYLGAGKGTSDTSLPTGSFSPGIPESSTGKLDKSMQLLEDENGVLKNLIVKNYSEEELSKKISDLSSGERDRQIQSRLEQIDQEIKEAADENSAQKLNEEYKKLAQEKVDNAAQLSQYQTEQKRRETEKSLNEKLNAYELLRNNSDFSSKSVTSQKERPDIGKISLDPSNADDVSYSINNKTPFRWSDSGTGLLNSDSEGDKYAYMSGDEKSLFNYIYNTSGKAEAMNYISALSKTLNERMTESNLNYAEDMAYKSPVAASAISVASNLSKPRAGTKDTANAIAGNPIDVNDASHQFGTWGNAVRSQISSNLTEKYGDGASFIYDTGMSAIDSAVNLAISGSIAGGGVITAAGEALSAKAAADATAKVTSALIGSQVSFDSIIQGKAQGWSDQKAVTVGAIRGLIEGITEKYSIESILSNPKATIGRFGKAFLSEGSEEVTSNWLNDIVNICTNDKDSVYNRTKNYVRQGHSQDEALSLALGDMAQDDFTSFLAGGISGVAMGATGEAMNDTMYYAPAGKEINSNGQRADVVAYEKANGDDYYKSLAEKVENSKGKKNVSLGKLTEDMQQSIGSKFESAGGYEQARQAYMKATESGNETARKTADAAFSNAAFTMALKDARNGTEGFNSEYEELDAQEENSSQERNAKARPYAATAGGKQVAVDYITSDSVPGNTKVSLSDGKKVDLEDVKFQDQTTQRLFNAASDMDGKSGRVFVNSYDGSSPVDVYTNTFRAFNAAGKMGMSLSDAMNRYGSFAKIIGEDKARIAYNAGTLQRKSEAKSLQAVKAVRAGTGTYEDRALAQNEAMKPLLKMVAKHYGITVERVETLAYTGILAPVPCLAIQARPSISRLLLYPLRRNRLQHRHLLRQTIRKTPQHKKQRKPHRRLPTYWP